MKPTNTFKIISRSGLSALVFATFAASLVGCGGGPSGRIRERDEESLVGDRRAGAAVYRNLIDGALKNLSRRYRDRTAAEPNSRIKMAYVGVDNRTKEELGSWRDQINRIIDQLINESGDFMDISFERFIVPAMREAGVSTSQMSLPKGRRALAQVLEQNGSPVDYFLFADLTQGDTRAGGLKQSDYVLTFTLMDLSGGFQLVVSEEISKEYVR